MPGKRLELNLIQQERDEPLDVFFVRFEDMLLRAGGLNWPVRLKLEKLSTTSIADSKDFALGATY